MSDADHRPAFYAARRGGLGQWWTLLHPPYTAWHLSYVVIGASLAPRVDTGRLLAAPWDPWPTLGERAADLAASDIYTLRRIVPEERGKKW